MKIIQKILLILLSITAMLIFNSKANASVNDSNLVKERLENVYAQYDGPDRVHLFYAEKLWQNGILAYCIEAGVDINTNLYSSTTDLSLSGFSTETMNYMRLVAYYAYNYPGHDTWNYYLAGQELIWEKASGRSVNWLIGETEDTLREYSIENEKNEILNLINNHSKTPSFSNQNINVNIGENTSITDTNNVLSDFQIYNVSDGITVNVNNNSLNITAGDIRGEKEVTFIKKNYTSQVALLYYDSQNQKMISAGVLDPVLARLKINVTAGSITINKLDSQTGSISLGDATLIGAKYGVYNADNELVDTLISGKKNTTRALKYGIYTVKEIEASTGYNLDPTVYRIEINAQHEDNNLDVFEDIIEKEITLFKVFASAETGMLIPEKAITFDIYLKSTGEYFKSINTDNNGKATLKLPYGNWIFKQKNVTSGYEKVKDFEVKVDENTDSISYKLISNSRISAKLKVIKIDESTNKIITCSGIKFRIKNLDTNEYITQTITYPTPMYITEFETDENGMLITPYPLPSGHYQLEEVDQQLNGYLWNKKPLLFTIDEKNIIESEYGKIVEVRFSNKEVFGELEINKVGEQLIIENNDYHYEEIKLDGVEYELYAKEDIYSADKTLMYKVGDLIDKYQTIDGYLKISDLHLGKYLIVETSTVGGHVLDKTEHIFELKYKDQYTPIVSKVFYLKNYLEKGKLEFTKTDLTDGKVIPNTTIEIYTEDDQLVFTGTTDENGKIVIDDLFVGKFYIVEKNAATGYKLNNEKVFFEIKENNEIVKANMTNEPLEIDVPNTFKNDTFKNTIFPMTMMTLIVISNLIKLYESSKNKIKNKK